MKRLGFIAFLIWCFASPASLAETNAGRIAMVYLFADFNHLLTACGSKAVNQQQVDEVWASADVQASDVTKGGDLYKSFIIATSTATDRLSGLNEAGSCYYLDYFFGADGGIIPNLVK